MTASLAALIVRLRAAADHAKDNSVADRLGQAAATLGEAVEAFNPTQDLTAGVRRMVSAIAAAQRAYSLETGNPLVEVATVGEPVKKKPRRKADAEPPEAA